MRYREIGSSQLLQRKEHPPGHSVLTVSTLRQLWESATILSVSLNTLDPTRLSSHAYTAYLGRGVQQAEEKQPACLRSGELERQSWTAHGLRQLWQTEKQSKLPAVPVPHYSFFPSCLCLQAGNVTVLVCVLVRKTWENWPEETICQFLWPPVRSCKHCISSSSLSVWTFIFRSTSTWNWWLHIA